jgi:hypothetical protein
MQDRQAAISDPAVEVEIKAWIAKKLMAADEKWLAPGRFINGRP